MRQYIINLSNKLIMTSYSANAVSYNSFTCDCGQEQTITVMESMATTAFAKWSEMKFTGCWWSKHLISYLVSMLTERCHAVAMSRMPGKKRRRVGQPQHNG